MNQRRHVTILLLIPQIMLIMVTIGFPAVYLGYMALTETDFIGWKWVGLGNFIRLATDTTVWRVIGNTLLYALFIVPPTILGALFAALIAYDLPRWTRSYLRVMLYLPTLTAGITIATVWRWIWHPSAGIANWVLSLIGLGPVWWFGGRISGIFAISTILVVGGLGFSAMTILAAILGVSRDLMDAAWIDGAGEWQIRWWIILPAIAPIVALLSTLSIIGTAQMWETVMMTTNGGPDQGTATLMYNIYETGFLRGQFGYGATKTVLLVTLVLSGTWVKKRLEAIE